MLYDFREWQRSLLNPLASFNKIGEHVFSSPLSPFSYSPVAPHIAATHGLLHRLGKEYVKPEWHIATTTVDGKTVDRKSTRLNSSHVAISYAVFCLKKKK